MKQWLLLLAVLTTVGCSAFALRVEDTGVHLCNVQRAEWLLGADFGAILNTIIDEGRTLIESDAETAKRLAAQAPPSNVCAKGD
jgi:hypothetical protein